MPEQVATAHFHAGEFTSPGYPKRALRVRVPSKYTANLRRLMAALETIRAALGGKPVRVISGYRTAIYNAQNKGRASRSQHLFARAADIVVGGMSAARVFWVVHELRRVGAIPKGGLAFYPKRGSNGVAFVHYDVRGRNAGWRPYPKVTR